MSENRLLQMFDYDKMEYSIQGFFRAKGYGDGLDALEFAKKKHGDARRKASNLKYVCHPILIAYLCTLLRLEPEIVAIALLHDVPEDAHTDFSALPGGPRVQAGVKALTIMKIKPDESKIDTKVRYYGRMDENCDALIVKLLDRLTNLASMVNALSQESIVKNILETVEKLIPAVNRGRDNIGLEFRSKRDVLFVLKQVLRSMNEPLALLFGVDSVERKKPELLPTLSRLKGRLEIKDSKGNFIWDHSDKALAVASKHTECYQNGDLRALRAMLMAAFAIDFGITDDVAIATILLGDLQNVDSSLCGPEVQHALRRLEMVPLEGEDATMTTSRYYSELSICKEALLAKALFRWYEICYGQVKGGDSISDEQMAALIIETDTYLIPALEYGCMSSGEFSSILEFMIYILRMTYETIAAYKQIPLKPIHGYYERKEV
ncbi:bifunctional (p)ppGpp synthetase/guanosine-3',5'-bis(diphosphate) 3'-pyrophosphohydrolase [Candidatus Saccharibacteria bacterium]|nr:bifunctional (p)ppGpp synthetase/guanosine-3',5'-bis(diphosphate) 3'-pyrophosphohydrolase [Candidatus Saccharibacteria bacterium]